MMAGLMIFKYRTYVEVLPRYHAWYKRQSPPFHLFINDSELAEDGGQELKVPLNIHFLEVANTLFFSMA